MGMSVGSGGLTNEPNVVPMIDILLVLLIIFMIMQPMMRRAIDLQLPDPTPVVAPANSISDQIVLEVLPNDQYQVNTQPLTKEALPARLMEIYTGRPDKIIFVKGHPDVKYQNVIFAMDAARGAGVKVIGVAPKDQSAPAAK
jgi:biopolymer transport protein TolR